MKNVEKLFPAAPSLRDSLKMVWEIKNAAAQRGTKQIDNNRRKYSIRTNIHILSTQEHTTRHIKNQNKQNQVDQAGYVGLTGLAS